ncbi:MAG: glycosyltransferase family 4 protein [Dehalococcoidia bacterium]
MHVLMLCALDVWALPGGGGAPSLYKTLCAYGERGHRVTFVSPTIGANCHSPTGRLGDAKPSPPPEIPGVSYRQFSLPSLQRLPLPMPNLAAKADQKLRFALAYPFLAARRAREVLQREPVDVLYAYEVHAALAARLLRRRWRLPTVARYQGTVMFPTLESRVARLRKYEEVLALRLPADLYIMTDDGTRGDDVIARLNPPAVSKLRFWRNGLDLDRLRPAGALERNSARRSLGLPDAAFVMVTASRLVAWKRLDRAVAALPEIVRQIPSALLLVVGDGDERERLARQAEALGVSSHVLFTGGVPQEEVMRYMHAADLFLAVADLTNVGNPLLEAMTCAMAIVAVDGGDTRDLIADGATGRLLPNRAPARIAAAVVELAGDAPLRLRLAAGARRYAEEHFWTWDQRLAAELEEVERLVKEPAQGRPDDRDVALGSVRVG